MRQVYYLQRTTTLRVQKERKRERNETGTTRNMIVSDINSKLGFRKNNLFFLIYFVFGVCRYISLVQLT